MDFPDARLAATLAVCGSLTAAAARLHMSLPAASIRLKNLERRLGAQLFYRSAQGMKTTAAGERFVELAERLLAVEEEIDQHFAAERHRRQHTLRIAGNTSYVTDILPAIIGRYQQGHPRVHIDLSCHRTAEILRDVERGDCELGFLSAPLLETDLRCFEFGDDPLELVVPAGSPLGAASSLDLPGFCEEEMICLADYSTMTWYLERRYQDAGRELRIKSKVLDFRTMCDYIGRGIGVGIMHRSIFCRYVSPALAHVPIAEPWARHRRYCVVNEDNPGFELASGFLAHAVENWGRA